MKVQNNTIKLPSVKVSVLPGDDVKVGTQHDVDSKHIIFPLYDE